MLPQDDPSGGRERAIEFVLRQEGGYVNDPRDPGGETNFGISKRAYPHLDIRNLTLEEARQIYRDDYWAKIRGDDLPYGLDLLVFDAAVSQGVAAAAYMLQDAINLDSVVKDGIIGPKTIAGARERNSLDLVIDFVAKRALRYVYSTPGNFSVYGYGWMRRLIRAVLEAC